MLGLQVICRNSDLFWFGLRASMVGSGSAVQANRAHRETKQNPNSPPSVQLVPRNPDVRKRANLKSKINKQFETRRCCCALCL